MSSGKLIQRLLNFLTVVLLIVLIGKIFFVLPVLDFIGTFPAVIALGVIYFTKNWIEAHYSISDPILANRISKMFYFLGMGCIVLAILFKIMHWPYQIFLMLVGVAFMIISYVLSVFLDSTEVEKDDNILDDID